MASTLEAHRAKRARIVGRKTCTHGLKLAVIVVLIDLAWKQYALLASDALITLGLIFSLLIADKVERDPRPAWWPICLAVWLAMIQTLAFTGGYQSPFYAFSIILLFMTGTIFQTRFSVHWVMAFTMLNFAAWAVLTHVLELRAVPIPPAPWIARIASLSSAIYVCISALLRTEEKLAQETAVQAQQLAETRESLVHAAKVGELGNMIASTAHQLAQPTQVIAGMSVLLSRKLEKAMKLPEDTKRCLWRIKEASTNLSQILRELQNYSRKDEFARQTLDLREPIRTVHSLVQHDFSVKYISLSVELSEFSLVVEGDSQRIQQIVLNLLNNAKDAATSAAARPSVTLRTFRHLDWARIEVVNNGKAIPLEIQGKLFQSYFTTKKKGHGTGLGLTICAQLVDAHGGRLFFASEEGQTRFVVDLPLRIRSQATA